MRWCHLPIVAVVVLTLLTRRWCHLRYRQPFVRDTGLLGTPAIDAIRSYNQAWPFAWQEYE